ncbi:MAG: glycoside hydrolase family 44 protein [Polyangiaceae bacterium]
MRRPVLFACLSILSLSTLSARADVTVTVEPQNPGRVISKWVYGVNFASDEQVAGGTTATRWGGNRTTRYNYEIDVDNTGQDYFFEALPGCWGDAGNYCSNPPADPKSSSGANAFLQSAADHGSLALFTIPTMGWVSKAAKYNHPFDCGCPVSIFGAQDQVDPYDTDCGNGQHNGQNLDCGDAARINKPFMPADAGGWVTYLTAQHGAAAGKRIYALDNEPALWSSTHRDVRKTRLGYDELWQRMRDYGAAIAAADPTAEIAGPAEWGYLNYLCSDLDMQVGYCDASSPDRANHNGEELVAWLLDQAKAYEDQTGTRILHYLDLHYYPQGGSNPERVRSLWDPSYTDPSWINAPIYLIPRMRAWVDQHYPGTKLAISEYSFYDHDAPVGAVTYAEVLGIFGRDGVDIATAWGAPEPNQIAFSAFRIFRNFDGQGGHFEDVSVPATPAGSNSVKAFASVSETRMTVVLANEGGGTEPATIDYGNFVPETATAYSNFGSATVSTTTVNLAANAAQLDLPPQSVTIVVLDGQNPNQIPDPGTGGAGGTGAGNGGGGPGPGPGAGGSSGGTGAGGDGASSDDSGCSCRAADSRAHSPILVALAALALVARSRRRR